MDPFRLQQQARALAQQNVAAAALAGGGNNHNSNAVVPDPVLQALLAAAAMPPRPLAAPAPPSFTLEQQLARLELLRAEQKQAALQDLAQKQLALQYEELVLQENELDQQIALLSQKRLLIRQEKTELERRAASVLSPVAAPAPVLPSLLGSAPPSTIAVPSASSDVAKLAAQEAVKPKSSPAINEDVKHDADEDEEQDDERSDDAKLTKPELSSATEAAPKSAPSPPAQPSRVTTASPPAAAPSAASRNEEEEVAPPSQLPPTKKRRQSKSTGAKSDSPPERPVIIYEVTDHDVLSIPSRGRGYDPPGNQAFHQTAKEFYDFYKDAKSKIEKNAVVTFIVDAVEKKGGRFLRRNDQQNNLVEDVSWVELSREEAMQKTRDVLIRLCSRKRQADAAAGSG